MICNILVLFGILRMDAWKAYGIWLGRNHVMTISKTRNENTVTLSLEGWLDYDAAPELKKALDELESDVTQLVIDCSRLEYISSSGVRVFVEGYNKMKGAIKLTHVSDDILEVLTITGVARRIPIE